MIGNYVTREIFLCLSKDLTFKIFVFILIIKNKKNFEE